MDFSRVSFGERVAGGAGLALLLFMFLPWYAVDASVQVPGGPSLGSEQETLNAWQAFGFVDFVLFLVVVAAVGMALLRAAGAMPRGLPAPPGLIVAGAGALAVLLILFRLIDTPGTDIDVSVGEVDIGRRIGTFLGLIAAGAITFGGYTAVEERARGEAARLR